MRRACVIGWPIGHSRSPLIHGYWLNAYGLEGSYTKQAVPPEDLGAFIRALGPDGFIGCNVTVPHKEAAYRMVVERDGVLHGTLGGAQTVNTLWMDADGRLNATSTDAHGFYTHLSSTLPEFGEGRCTDKTVMVLGAGGAAKSVLWALGGFGEIRISNRSIERAREAVSHLGSVKTAIVPWEERSAALADCALVVNTTSLGMAGQPPLDIDLSALPGDAVVYDLVYVPLETPLLKAARERGLRTVDGLGMLLHQAVPGFMHWFGVRPEVTDELRALIVADIEGHR